MNELILGFTEYLSWPLAIYMLYSGFLCWFWAHDKDQQKHDFGILFIIQCSLVFLYFGNNYVYAADLDATLSMEAEFSWRIFHFIFISFAILKNQQALIYHEYAERRLFILFYNKYKKGVYLD